MRRFLILNTDGTATYDNLNDDDEGQALRALQYHVGGHIQLLPGGHLHGCSVFLNEDGQELDLAPNPLAATVFGWPGELLGNVVVTGGVDENLDTAGLSDEQLDHLHTALATVDVVPQ